MQFEVAGMMIKGEKKIETVSQTSRSTGPWFESSLNF